MTPLRLLDRRAARDDKPGGFLEPALELGAHRGADRDALVEHNDLHRNVGIWRAGYGRGTYGQEHSLTGLLRDALGNAKRVKC